MTFFDSKFSDKPKLQDSIAKLEEIQVGVKQNLAKPAPNDRITRVQA
jgi:hypothetical protein